MDKILMPFAALLCAVISILTPKQAVHCHVK
jgi:hypothetical protein